MGGVVEGDLVVEGMGGVGGGLRGGRPTARGGGGRASNSKSCVTGSAACKEVAACEI